MSPPRGLTSWLILGGRHLLDGTSPPRDDEPLVFSLLPLGTSTPWGGNTVVLDWAQLGELELCRSGNVPYQSVAVPSSELFHAMRPGPVLRGVTDGGPVVPLFLLQELVGPDGPDVHVFSQIRFAADDACFIRVTPQPLPGAATELRWLPEALKRCADDALFLNNHQRYYRKCFPGKELEHKYTMQPPTADIWTLTCELYELVARGALPGYVLEYRDEFQAWDYLNHLYQVTAPDDERGYVSFIPTTDGKNLVKRKWFVEDAFERREEHTYGVVPADGFDSYVREQLGLQATRLPSFRRVRYDINFESVRTGHVYGIFFDTVTLVDAPEVRLQQCELEYLRSRTVVEPDPNAALEQLTVLAEWLEDFLRAHGLADERGTYSKLSFLLDSVAARPDLAVELVGR